MGKIHTRRSREGVSYWSSYSDMMASLILLLVLLLCVTLIIDKKEIEDTREKYEDIVGVRKDIIEQLINEFGEDFEIEIDRETGDIMFSSQILFDVDRTDLKPNGKDFLKEFFPRYIQVLMRDGIKENISEIIVEGHTDPDGGYAHNLELSQGRATSVVLFCMNEKNPILSPDEIAYLQTVLSSNGKSFSELKYFDEAKQEVDKESSRRVEIKFRLYEEEQINEIIALLHT